MSKYKNAKYKVNVLPKCGDIYRKYLGSDPEFFVQKDGKVVSSEVVGRIDNTYDTFDLVRDGIPLELQPDKHNCRQVSFRNIALGMLHTVKTLKKKGLKLDLRTGVTIEKDIFRKIKSEDKRFGCSPTKGLYKDKNRVTGLRTRFRAAGGHIHYTVKLDSLEEEQNLVKLWDLMVALPFVVLDKDPANIERRKNYGRAGEYRRKDYGIEYRVLSNLWLRHYILWSFATAQMRNAEYILKKEPQLRDKILKEVPWKDVRKAINNNDKDLALYLINRHISDFSNINTYIGVDAHYNDLFQEWINKDNPLEGFCIDTYEGVLTNWSNMMCTYRHGFESFLLYNFRSQLSDLGWYGLGELKELRQRYVRSEIYIDLDKLLDYYKGDVI